MLPRAQCLDSLFSRFPSPGPSLPLALLIPEPPASPLPRLQVLLPFSSLFLSQAFGSVVGRFYFVSSRQLLTLRLTNTNTVAGTEHWAEGFPCTIALSPHSNPYEMGAIILPLDRGGN